MVCVDETFKQLIGETREPLPPRPGAVERYDHVYVRNGTASLFLACEPLQGWRHSEVTQHRRRTDWAGFIRALLEGRYQEAEKLVLVMRPSVLKPELLDKLKARLRAPPPDGGLWTSSKVAAWMAGELGLAAVLPQRGWEALKAIGWSVQKPRPRHPASATPEERTAFKKGWSRPSPRKLRSTRTNRSRSGPRMGTASG